MKFNDLTLETPAAAPVVTLADAKLHLRVDHSDEDDYITGLVAAATEFAEEFTGRAFIQQVWKVKFCEWPQYRSGRLFFELPRPVVRAVSAVEFYNTNDVLTTLDSSKYLFEPGDPASVSIFSVPTTSHKRLYPVEITFTTGYGSAKEDVPTMIVHAIKLMVKHFYEIRMPVLENMNATKVPLSALSILKMKRVRYL